MDIRLKTLATVPIFKERGAGFSARPLQFLMCAQFRVRLRGATSLVVGLGGLEPPASPLSGVRSNHLSYRPKVLSPPALLPGKND